MTPFDKAFEAVGKLVDSFQANENFFLSQKYQEIEVRRDFIDKFFNVLGWDVYHERQKNPYEQEVKVEHGQRQGIARRRADYAFSLGPNYRDVRFFVEAKKPHGDLESADNYFQTIRYGWNSHNLVAALTDFEQFHILDCRYMPNIDTALQRGWKKIHYSQYKDAEKFAEIYWLFSREAVGSGSLDPEKLTPLLPKARGKAIQRGLFKGGYQSMDESFLEKLDEHRKILALAFKNKNPELDSETLTEITQRTIDRLVFIRFLEDRLIEDRYHVEHYGENGTAWGDFIADCRRLDKIYNGIVFKEHQILDSSKFKVDDDAFSGICEELTHINTPYDFNAIPIHILGSIYERFLGKVIVATDKRAKVEQKLEVRNAGGVFYTPEYIVRYIVHNTVGKIIDGKTPTQVANMRFADIACGSGSFLLGVYDLLLRWHSTYYNEHPTTAKKGDLVQKEDGLHLSLRKRREILLNNIYAVDIDAQAVEVAQLSLYLKLLQEETAGTKQDYQTEFHETLLPPLNKNIVCGNSLIGTDISSGELFEPVEERKLNPMDYKQRFPEIMRSGGFDAIVGNPPYVDIKGLPVLQVNYLFAHYASANNRINLFAAFIERGLQICKQSRFRFAMIVPTSLLTQDSYKALRKYILEQFRIVAITRLPNESFGQAAGDVKVDTMILIVDSLPKPDSTVEITSYSGYDRIANIDPEKATVHTVIPQSIWSEADDYVWSLNLRSDESTLLKKIETNSVQLDKCAEFCLGLTPYDKYKGHTPKAIAEQIYHSDRKKDKTFKMLLSGNDVMHYQVKWNGLRWISYGPWLGAPREQRFFTEKRILVKQIVDWTSKRIWAGLTSEELYNTQNAFNLIAKPGWCAEFLLAIINSRLMTFYHRKKFLDEFKMRFQKILIKDCRRFPIPDVDLATAAEKTRHDKIVQLVSQIIDAKERFTTAKNERDQEFYKNKFEALDHQIEALVYDLYGLTKEEIEIVEGATQ